MGFFVGVGENIGGLAKSHSRASLVVLRSLPIPNTSYPQRSTDLYSSNISSIKSMGIEVEIGLREVSMQHFHVLYDSQSC